MELGDIPSSCLSFGFKEYNSSLALLSLLAFGFNQGCGDHPCSMHPQFSVNLAFRST